MALSIDKRDKETAQREGLYLFQISLDSRYVNDPAIKLLKSEWAGACSPSMAKAIMRFMRRWQRKTE